MRYAVPLAVMLHERCKQRATEIHFRTEPLNLEMQRRGEKEFQRRETLSSGATGHGGPAFVLFKAGRCLCGNARGTFAAMKLF